jgi:hypothetical protein
MEIFNNYKDFIKFIETKTKKDDDFNKYLDKLNDSILKNYNLILENKKDYSITDDDIKFDDQNEKNKITYYQKQYEDSNFNEILNLIKKPQKKTGGYDKNIFESFIKFIDNLTILANKDSNINEIYKLYEKYIINDEIDTNITNRIYGVDEEEQKGGADINSIATAVGKGALSGATTVGKGALYGLKGLGKGTMDIAKGTLNLGKTGIQAVGKGATAVGKGAMAGVEAVGKTAVGQAISNVSKSALKRGKKLFLDNTKISKEELINRIIGEIPKITKDINNLKDLIVKFKNSNDASKLLLEDYKIEKDGYLYSYRIEEFIKLLTRVYEIINIRFLEFINNLTKELYKYDKNFFQDPKVQQQFVNGNIDKLFDFSGLSISVNYDEIERLLEDFEKEDVDKLERIAFLDKYKEVFNPTTGQWKTDFDKEKDNDKKNKINTIQKRFQKLIIKYLSQESKISDEYGEASEIFEQLKTIKSKLEKQEKLKKDEYDIIVDENKIIKKLKENKRFKDDDNYLDIIANIQDLYNSIKNEGKSKEVIEQIKEAKAQGKETDDLIIDPNKIYFSDYVPLFKLSLKLLVYLSILMIFFILFLSIIAFFKLIYDLITNIIYLFVNGSSATRGLTLDYLSKSITRCTKTNYDYDRFYILTEQKQNLTLFNIGIYMIYLLLIYIFLYFILLLYAKIVDKIYVANPNEIDKSSLFLSILAVIIIYSSIHLLIFKKVYKEYVYIPYKEIEKREKEIDQTIAEYILIYPADNQNQDNPNVLVDDIFFKLLYDPSRIDELNEIFKKGVLSNDIEKCLEQKIIIYNIYCYLREYIVFDKTMQDNFKEYCTTTADNKPKYKDDDTTITFISLLDNNEIKMIKKYNEDLPYYTSIPNDKIDYFNKLNLNISEKIKEINMKILINTNTSVPFFLTIIYIIFIIILNLVVIYLIIQIILKSSEGEKEFNEYLFRGLNFINENVYNPIFKYLTGK